MAQVVGLEVMVLNFQPLECSYTDYSPFLIVYASQSIYQLDASERAVILRLGKFHEEQQEGLNFRLAGIDERYIENVTLTRRYTQTNSMLTKDENIVDVTVSAQYRIANLKDFVLKC